MIDEMAKKIIEFKKDCIVHPFDFQGPDVLKASPETRYAIGMFLQHWIILRMMKEIGEELGYDKAAKYLADTYGAFCEELVSYPVVKKDMWNSGQKGITKDPTVLAATMVFVFDYMFGHIDKIDEEKSSPGRTCVVNIDCKIWEMMKEQGIEKKFNCEGGCAQGLLAVGKAVHPKMKLGRQGEKNYEMDFCRCRGDDVCGGWFYLEE